MIGCAIYALVDPRAPLEVRYVGKTSRRVQSRLRDHIAGARFGKERSHKNNWIASLLADGVEPVARLIEVVGHDVWQESERKHIAAHKAAGHPLTNGTEGGDGISNPPPEVRQKISDALKGRSFSDSHRMKLRHAHQGRTLTDDHKLKISMGGMGHACTELTRAKIGDANRGRKLSAEVLENVRQSRRPISAETREKMRQAKLGRAPSKESIEKGRKTAAANRAAKLQLAGRI